MRNRREIEEEGDGGQIRRKSAEKRRLLEDEIVELIGRSIHEDPARQADYLRRVMALAGKYARDDFYF